MPKIKTSTGVDPVEKKADLTVRSASPSVPAVPEESPSALKEIVGPPGLPGRLDGLVPVTAGEPASPPEGYGYLWCDGTTLNIKRSDGLVSGLIPESEVTPPSAFAIGTSLTNGHTAGAGGDVGGWRAHIQTPITWKGPTTDAAGKHAGVDGDTFALMEARVATDYAGNEADEIIVDGAANEVNNGLTAAQAATALDTFLTELYSIVAASKVTRITTNPYLEYVVSAKDAVLAEFNRRIANVVATHRAAGRAVVVHDCGGLLETNAHLDGSSPGGLEHPINGVRGAPGTGTGYGLWGWALDQYLSGGTSDPTMGGLTLEESYDADTISGAQLTDKSGNARHITLFNSPTAGTGINGRPKLTFNGTTQYGRTGTGYTIAQPSVVTLIARPTSASGGPALLDGATTAARQGMFCNTSSQFQAYAGAFGTDTLLNPLTIPHCYIFVFNGASSKLYVDGIPRRVNFNPSTQGGNGFTLFASAAASPSNFTAGDFYRLERRSGGVPTDVQVQNYMRSVNADFGFWPAFGQPLAW